MAAAVNFVEFKGLKKKKKIINEFFANKPLYIKYKKIDVLAYGIKWENVSMWENVLMF